MKKILLMVALASLCASVSAQKSADRKAARAGNTLSGPRGPERVLPGIGCPHARLGHEGAAGQHVHSEGR